MNVSFGQSMQSVTRVVALSAVAIKKIFHKHG